MAKRNKPGKPKKPSIGRLKSLNLAKREKKELMARMKKLTGDLWQSEFKKIKLIATEKEIRIMRIKLRSQFQRMDADAIEEAENSFKRHYPDPRNRKKVIDMLVEEPRLLNMQDIPAFKDELCNAWLSERVKQEKFKRLPEKQQIQLAASAVFQYKAEAELFRQAFLRNVFHRFVTKLKKEKKKNGVYPSEKEQKRILSEIYTKEHAIGFKDLEEMVPPEKRVSGKPQKK